MMNKIIRTVLLVISMLIVNGNFIFAKEAQNFDDEVINESESTIVEDERFEEDEILTTIERTLESNFVTKEYEIEGENNNHYLVEGGNEKAINSLATEQNIANGTLVENTNVEGESYNMELLDDEDYDSKNTLELRQFISFETKSGKVFHLIIDHSKSGDNVMMLSTTKILY